jgi:glucokinase
MGYLIGMDIGGTNIVCGLLDPDGKLIRKMKLPTEVEQGSVYVISKISNMIKELLAAENISTPSLKAVGVGMPGFVDPMQGISLFAANLQWKDVPLAALLSSQINTPVFIDNDVRMYVYGEAMNGAGQGYDTVFGLTIGTGLASALVSNGELYYGGGFLAGEIGHIPMEGVQQLCNCGMIGCLETIVSATGIARQARSAIHAGNKSILQEWHSDLSEITALDVSKAYDLDDKAALKVMQYSGKLLGRGLSYAVPILSPDIIIIGGGAALAGERLLAPMREELRRLVHPMYWERLQIKQAEWIDDAGVIGSALYAKSRVDNADKQ